MADIKVTIELEVSENFKPCEKNCELECPLAYYNYDDGVYTCDFGEIFNHEMTCPMKKMKRTE